MREVTKEQLSEAYARLTSKKFQRDNYVAHQQRVKKARSKYKRELAEFGRRQQETKGMAMEDKDTEVKYMNASTETETEFKEYAKGESNKRNNRL